MPSYDAIDWAIVSMDDPSAIAKVVKLASNDSIILNEVALWNGIRGLAIPKETRNTPWGIFWIAYRTINEHPDSARNLLMHIGDMPQTSDTLKLFSDFLIAESYLKEGSIVAAVDKLNVLLNTYPNSFLSGIGYYKLALCYLTFGQYSSSAEFAEIASQMCKPSRDTWCIDALFIRGISLVLMDSLSQAEAIAKNLELVGESQKAKNIRMLINAPASGDSESEPYFKALAMLNHGWSLMDSARLDSAKTVLLNAAKISDRLKLISLLFAGECAYRLRQWSLAESLFNQAKEDSILRCWSLWGLGWTAFRNNNHTLARARWDSIRTDSIFAREVIFAQAKSFFAQGNHKRSAQLSLQYLNDCKLSCIEAVQILCRSLIAAGDTALAMNKSGEYLLKYPDNRRAAQTALFVAQALFHGEKYEILFEWAESLASSLSNIWGDSLELWAQRAAFRAGISEDKDPVEIVKKFAQRRPKSPLLPKLWLTVGEQYLGLKQFDNAIYCFSRAKALALPGDTTWCEAQVVMLSAYLAKNDTTTALKALDELRVNGELYWISEGEFKYAKYYISRGDPTSAMELLKQVKEKRSKSPFADSASLYISQLYIEFGMSNEAMEYLLPLWKKIPNGIQIKTDIAKQIITIMWETGDPQSAFKWAFARIDSVPNQCGLIRKVGELAIEDGISEIASKTMDELIKRKCKDLPVSFLFRMGDIMAQSNRTALACSIFTVIRDVNPNDSLGIKAGERLKAFYVDSMQKR